MTARSTTSTTRRLRKAHGVVIGITAELPAAQISHAVVAATPVDDRAPKPSKAAMVVSLLQRVEGASLQQLVEATGWLPHTTRAALTGLKRKGYTVVSYKPDGVRIYRVINMASAA